jgi:hypothetical protein
VFLKAWNFSTSWNVLARGGTFFGEVSAEKKGWNFFLLERAGRGGTGRDKKEVKGRGGERRGGEAL